MVTSFYKLFILKGEFGKRDGEEDGKYSIYRRKCKI
jgi:hypothetical protein